MDNEPDVFAALTAAGRIKKINGALVVTRTHLRKIRTDFIYPPIPIRCCDWQAVWDDDEPDDDGRMKCGHGATEQAAINDLLMDDPPCQHEADYVDTYGECLLCGAYPGEQCSV